MKLQVLIVDDEPLVHHDLSTLLDWREHGFELGGQAYSGADALALIEQSPPHIAIIDVNMPDMNGVDLLERLKDIGASIPAVVITGHGDVPMAVAAMKAGAVDFIEKPFEDEVLVDAIKRAASRLDERPAPVEDTSTLRARLQSLSEREQQVLSAVVAGLPNKSIAYDLGISPRTVEVHRANIMSKMQARNLPELVRMSIAMGITS